MMALRLFVAMALFVVAVLLLLVAEPFRAIGKALADSALLIVSRGSALMEDAA